MPDRSREQLGRYYRDRFLRLKALFPGFDPVAVEAHLGVLRTADMVFGALARHLRPHGLTPPSFGMLILLETAGRPVPMRELGRQSVVTQANITGVMDTLEKAGLARRRPDAKDRRVILAAATEAGRAKLRKLLPGYMRLVQSLYSGLTPAESRVLRRSLEKIRGKVLPLLGALALAFLGPAAGASAQTLPLKGAVETALRENPALRSRRAALDQAVSRQLALLGSYDPSLRLSLLHLDAKTPPAVFFQTPKTVTDSAEAGLSRRFSLGTQADLSAKLSREKDNVSSAFVVNPRLLSNLNLSVTQPLLKGLLGRPERAALAASELEVRAARAELKAAAETLTLAVAEAYWGLWRARGAVELIRASLEESAEFAQTTRKLLDRYQAERDDLLRAEASLLAKELEVLESRELARRGAESLAALMAADPAAVEAAALEEPSGPEEVPSEEDAAARALALRQDLAAAELKAEGARLHLKATAGLGFPALDLTGSWGWSGLKTTASESLSQLGRLGWRTWSVGLNFSYAFGARADKGRRLEARAFRDSAGARLEELRLEAARQARGEARRLRLAAERLRIARRLASMQSEILELSRRKYGLGRIGSRDRLEASTTSLGARSERLAAEAEWASALAAQKAAEGSLLDWLGVPPSAAIGGSP